ncbi:hypothetical protein BDV30DRAFT_211610 [Aspergillus minisclerotigenes]|uniref:Uncharacterized protein n=1 Tax=Aspergillus minisclerotigenes TaxID=656917 RepID=A0A5N6J399_9EURO|nr:hypothetical protein BDV30DRAFT_211610 [Aspergillus minisclerotigenes]
MVTSPSIKSSQTIRYLTSMVILSTFRLILVFLSPKPCAPLSIEAAGTIWVTKKMREKRIVVMVIIIIIK